MSDERSERGGAQHTPGPWQARQGDVLANVARLIDEAFAGVRRELDDAHALLGARAMTVADLRSEREALREALRGMVDMLDHGLLAFNTSPGEVQKAGLAKARALLASTEGGAK